MKSESSNIPSSSGSTASADVALKKAATGAHSTVERAADAADDMAKMAAPAIGRVASYAHGAVDKAVDAAAPAANWLDEQRKDLLATPQRLADGTCDYVKAHPWKALGMAAAAGFVISRIVF